MSVPYETFRFDWLTAPGQAASIHRPEQGDLDWLPYPLPPELGTGGFQKIELALGMAVFRGVHRFLPAAVGQLIPLAEIEVRFPGPTFQVQILRGGRILHRELHPACELLYSPGLDLFRLTDRLDVIPVLDGSSSSEMTCLTIGRDMLDQLIGAGIAEELLTKLGLTDCPRALVRQIPLHVSAHLHDAIPESMTGATRRLHCQARVLDYLVALIKHVNGTDAGRTEGGTAQERVWALHEQLLRTEGKLPTLDELARQFGRSARLLNEEFTAEFGESIYAFITARRLTEAHAAIQNTGVPLKALAQRLGYAHVNHFNAAFKKKFGYPPGSLRKGGAK